MGSLPLGERPATIVDVARRAGVSTSTASRVMNNQSRVSAAAQRSVRRAAKELGYVPNRAARSLVTGRTGSIGVVIPQPDGRLYGDPSLFFQRLLQGIGEVVSAHERLMVLLTPQTSSEGKRVVEYLIGRHVDGALMVALPGLEQMTQDIARSGLPVVSYGAPADPTIPLNYVDVDNVAGSARAAAHLVAQGCRTIATITGPLGQGPAPDRLRGYEQALRDAHLLDPRLREESDFTHEGGIAAMQRLLEREPGIDGVFCASDLAASGAVRVLLDAGRAIPADVAVVGYDDSAVATSTVPSLTSVRQPIEELGREMVRLLLSLVDTAPESVARHVILGTELVVRESSIRSTVPIP